MSPPRPGPREWPLVAGALVALAIVGCTGPDITRPTEPRGAWLWDRGAAGRRWEGCLRIASAMRAECGGDGACERSVSEDFSRICYAGQYRDGADDPAPFAPSPCFWNRNPTSDAGDLNDIREAAAFAVRRCSEVDLDLRLQPHCQREILFFALDFCGRGHTDLTGAGP
jgi:hypothetical protein